MFKRYSESDIKTSLYWYFCHTIFLSEIFWNLIIFKVKTINVLRKNIYYFQYYKENNYHCVSDMDVWRQLGALFGIELGKMYFFHGLKTWKRTVFCWQNIVPINSVCTSLIIKKNKLAVDRDKTWTFSLDM